MNNTPKFEKWDSQIILLAKGHYDEHMKELKITNLDVLAKIYSKIYAIGPDKVPHGYIFWHLLKVIAKVRPHNTDFITGLIDPLVNNSSWKFGVSNDAPILEKLIGKCMSTISGWQISDTVKDGEEEVRVALIEMEALSSDFIEELYEEFGKEE